MSSDRLLRYNSAKLGKRLDKVKRQKEMCKMAQLFAFTAYETFAPKSHYLDMLTRKEWSSAGIENWVQIELAFNFNIRGFKVTTVEKLKHQCDLRVGKSEGPLYGIELRCSTHADSGLLRRVIEDHPKADFYLILTKSDFNSISEIQGFAFKDKLMFTNKQLGEEWEVMVVWRTVS